MGITEFILFYFILIFIWKEDYFMWVLDTSYLFLEIMIFPYPSSYPYLSPYLYQCDLDEECICNFHFYFMYFFHFPLDCKTKHFGNSDVKTLSNLTHPKTTHQPIATTTILPTLENWARLSRPLNTTNNIKNDTPHE